MATYIYRTESFNEDLARDGYWAGRVNKKLNDDDLSSKLVFLKRSDNLWVYRFEKTSNAPRIVFQKIVSGEHIVLCALRFMWHTEYDNYDYKWDEWAQKNRIDEATILQWLSKKIEEEKPKLKPLDDNHRAWLTQKVKYEIANDIYEMREWITSFESKEWNEDNIYGKLYEIATGTVTLEDNVKLPEDTRATVICTKTTNSNIYILSERINNTTFLYNLYDHEPSCDELESVLRNYSYSEGDDVLKFLKEDSLRAYEEWILAGSTDKEKQVWKNIEHDKDGNLALSSEQLKILNLPLFPIFINGQAGSGKSTLLYYIFAMLYREQINNPYKPIFLTYNERLLDVARDTVLSILQNNTGFKLDIDESDLKDLFWPFQTFIKEKLLKPFDREQFPKDKHLSFNKFKKYYTDPSNQFGFKQKTKYSPELVWHIIRSYIEGRSTSIDFSIDDYKKLGRDDKNVQEESLSYVINNIWKTWYKGLKKQGFWDDQDLVKFALVNSAPYEKYALIVCDEAQDFTRNEINLLLRLSVFSDNYDLEDCTAIPFAFAGDPYQTINPTGFRWASLKSMFDDMFGKLFRMYDHSMNEQPMLENYRSRPSIIQFANLIQLYRVALISADLMPQELRSERTLNDLSRGMKPSLFIIGDNIDLSELKDSIKNTTIIIPCEGETLSEREYAKGHDFLKAFIEIPIENDKYGKPKPEEMQPPIPNLYSAASIKGLERDKVIIFGFGDACPEEFAKSLSSNKLSDDEKLVLSYFFNKLYVAASRAKNDLFIIDTPKGVEKFWKHFQNKDTVIRFTKYPEWSNKLVFLRDGEPDDIARMGETSPAIIAKDLFQNGLKTRNINWLQRAALYFERAQLYDDAKRSHAEVAFLNEEWTTAGDLFCNLRDPFIEKAQNAYWNGECWQKIIDMPNASDNYVLVSKYMLRQISVYDLFANNNHSILMSFKYDDPTWVKVIWQIHNDLTHEETNIMQSAMVAKQVADTWPLDYKRFYDLAAEQYFKAKSYPLAAECWEHGENGCEHDSYYESKLHTSTDSNQKVEWLYRLRRFKDVIIYDNDPNNNANTNEKILSSLILTKDYSRAVQYKKLSEEAKKREFILALPGLSAIDQLNLFDALFDGGYQKFLKERLQSFKTLLLHKDVIGKLLGSPDESFHEELSDLMKTDPAIISSTIEAIADELRNDNYEHLPYALDIVGIDPQNHVILESKLINAIALASDNLKIRDDFRVRILGLTSKWFWEDKAWMQAKIISYRDIVMAAKKCQEHFSELYKMCDYLIQYEKNDKLWALKYLVEVKSIEASLKKTQSKLTEYAAIRQEIRTLKSQITKIEGPKAQSKEKKEKNVTKADNKEKKQEKKPSQNKDSVIFGKLIISGLSEFKSEKDARRGSITFELKQHDIKVYGKTSKIEIQSLETDDTDEMNLEKHTYNKRPAKSCKKYRMRFSEDGLSVKFYVEGVEIIIKRENG